MAITVQYETDGIVNEWLLDIIEVGRRHTGERLAIEFEKVLDNFGISNKVHISSQRQVTSETYYTFRFLR